MSNHYENLGINSSATADEIRRAYRVLARRYHPDLNPGKNSEERFKKISESYGILSDPEKRRVYDIEFEGEQLRSRAEKVNTYRKAQERFSRARRESAEGRAGADGAFWKQASKPGSGPEPETQKTYKGPKPPNQRNPDHASFGSRVAGLLGGILPKVRERKEPKKAQPIARVSILEASITFADALNGTKKTIEISEPEGGRKVSVRIPPGSRNGSVIRLRSKDGKEDLIIIVRVAYHPFMSIQTKGLVAEIPITIFEALGGASISVPTLDEPVIVKIPPGVQSGTEVRLKEKGIRQKDGSRGDFFIRFMVQIPESPEAVGLKDKAQEIEKYYARSVRSNLPRSLTE